MCTKRDIHEICFTEVDNGSTEKTLSKDIVKKFKRFFSENTEVQIFKYNVTFRNDFKIEQQRGRRIPIHVQEAAEAVANFKNV